VSPEAAVSTIILCGGRGARLGCDTSGIPKPMTPIGGRPLVWHIMSLYASYAQQDFVLALGRQAETFREYFAGARETVEARWQVTCLATGDDTLTTTRVVRAARVCGGKLFMVTYGDGLADVDIRELLSFHRSHGRLATLTAVHPVSRFGALKVGGNGQVTAFEEKPPAQEMVNGGFMVFDRAVIERFLEPCGDVMLERGPLPALAAAGELMAYRHEGFWHPMDTPNDRDVLQSMWESGDRPWLRSSPYAPVSGG
jgi:glucose-1-phosphate cytidylyltransferase